MGQIIEKTISSTSKIKSKIPLSENLKSKILKDRKEIIDIIENKDKRILLIVGPCSAWPDSAVIEYAKKLQELNKKYSNKIKIIMRTYTQKPRTNLGWTGPANQPDPFKPADIEEGIKYCRKMMIEVIKIGLPIADEALFTHYEGYFSDLLSWIAIGARSSENQEHRIYASMIEHPVGLKNPTSGNIEIAINSIIAAQNKHTFLLNQKQIKTTGNKHAHLILRGGDKKPNLNKKTFNKCIELFKKNKILNPSIICDVSHDNSINKKRKQKDYKLQPKVLINTLNIIKKNPEYKRYIKGFMIESFLKEGNQNINNKKTSSEIDLCGLSITDACINFIETKKLIEKIYYKL